MKKRFRSDEDDDDFEDDLFPDIDDEDDDEFEDDELNEDYLRILEKREVTEAAKVELIQKQINYDILNKALDYSIKDFFWWFKSKKTKLKLIIESYQTFKTLVDLDSVTEKSADDKEI